MQHRMAQSMSDGVWESESYLSRAIMDRRIRVCTGFLSWQHIVRIILEKKIPVNCLKIAEVGCGTGTLSLTFGLMGASVTLIDFNQTVLEKAKKIYDLYNCVAEFVKADCLELPTYNLREKFDLVISSGLAEHFIDGDRDRCLRYHKYLLNLNGFACIGVPNALSPFYQFVRKFKKLTGTWEIDIEIPYTPGELRVRAERIGFMEVYVIGNAPLKKDVIDYLRGFGAAIKALFPAYVRKRLVLSKEIKNDQFNDIDDMRNYCQDIVHSINQGFLKRPHSPLIDHLSAGIYLFAFNHL